MVPGREGTDKNVVHHVTRLSKRLYGDPQAPADWHGTIRRLRDPSLSSPTPASTSTNPTTKKGPTFTSWNKDTVILTIYVNDFLLVRQNKMLIKQLEEKRVRRFDTKYMGDV